MRLLRTRLTLRMSCRDSLRNYGKLQRGEGREAQCHHYMNNHVRAKEENEEQTRKSIQLRAKVICVIGYGCRVARQYSRSSSASDIGSVLGLFLKPTMFPLKSSGSMTHGCVKFPKSTNCLVQVKFACQRHVSPQPQPPYMLGKGTSPDYQAWKAPNPESRSSGSPSGER
jgi:hypothetical protein